jgi:hypothetical protein
MPLAKTLSVLENNLEVRACLGRLYALAGRLAEATDVIMELTGTSQVGYVQPYFIALIYEALGEKDHGFDWLERGYSEHDEDLELLNADPRLDSLRGDAKFTNLMEKIGLSNATNRRTLEAASGGRPLLNPKQRNRASY